MLYLSRRTPTSRLGKNSKGFSLVELLVVVAILAILAAIAIPLFLNQKDKANTANVKSDMHTIIVEMETLRNSLAPGTSYTNATQVANAINPVWTSSSTGIQIYINCSVDSTLSTPSVSAGNYIIFGMKPSAANTWNTPWSGGGWVYDSASSRWSGPYASTPGIFSVGAGTTGTVCGSGVQSGGAYWAATK